MADGYVLLEVSEDRRTKIKDAEINWIDLKLEMADVDFEASEGLEQLTEQLPSDIRDALVLVAFRYRVESSYDSWSGATEYEDFYDAESFLVVKEGYKEFYRGQVEVELNVGINGHENINSTEFAKDYYKELVAEWEEFYNEDFKTKQLGDE